MVCCLTMCIPLACKSYNSRDIRPLWHVTYPLWTRKHLGVKYSPQFRDNLLLYKSSPSGSKLPSPYAVLSIYINKITNTQEVLLGGLLRQLWLSGYCCPGVFCLNDCGHTSRADKLSWPVQKDVWTVV